MTNAPLAPQLSPELTELQRAEIRRLAERADELVEASLSANSRRAYATAWRQWSA